LVEAGQEVVIKETSIDSFGDTWYLVANTTGFELGWVVKEALTFEPPDCHE
jgi:hypothetical protein